ncbi:MAG: hypothetical protein AAGJ10_11975 [Bacteroidota bacterium]
MSDIDYDRRQYQRLHRLLDAVNLHVDPILLALLDDGLIYRAALESNQSMLIAHRLIAARRHALRLIAEDAPTA